MRGQCPDRRVGAAAAVNWDVGKLAAADFRIGPAGPVERALMIKRRRLGPNPAQERHVFCGAAIAGLGVGPVAVLGLIGVAAAGDDVHRQTATAQLIERRQLAGGDRRCDETRPMRQQKTQPLGNRGGMRPDQEPIGRIREIADQHAVEAGPLVDARGLGDHRGVERRPGRGDQLGRDPRRDPADHLHRHGNAFPNRRSVTLSEKRQFIREARGRAMMAGRVPMVSLERARELGEAMGMPARRTQSEAFRTVANNPGVARVAFSQLMQLLENNKFDTRLRELMIMRIGWVTGSAYEWTQHWRVATTTGIPAEDILAVRDWQNSDRLTPADKAILAATDECLAGKSISDPVWAEGAKHVSDPGQQVELIIAMGNWMMFSLLFRNLRIPLAEGLMVLPPDGKASPAAEA